MEQQQTTKRRHAGVSAAGGFFAGATDSRVGDALLFTMVELEVGSRILSPDAIRRLRSQSLVAADTREIMIVQGF